MQMRQRRRTWAGEVEDADDGGGERGQITRLPVREEGTAHACFARPNVGARARDFFAILCRFSALRTHISVCALVFRGSGEHPPGAAIRQEVPVVRNSTPAHQSSTHKLQQSRHLASSIIAMPSVMFKGHRQGPQRVRLPMLRRPCASRRIVLSRRRCGACMARSAQQGLQDRCVDGRAEDEDARRGLHAAAATRPAGEPPWQPQLRFRVRRATPSAARTTRAILPQPRAQVPGDERRRGDRHAQHVGPGRRHLRGDGPSRRAQWRSSRRPRRRTEGCSRPRWRRSTKQSSSWRRRATRCTRATRTPPCRPPPSRASRSAAASTTPRRRGAWAKYAAAGQFVQPEFTLCAVRRRRWASRGWMPCSYFHKVSSEMQVGAELSKAMNKSDVALPWLHKLDKDTTVKSKVDSDGMLFGSYKAWKISPMSTLTLATQIDTVKLAEYQPQIRAGAQDRTVRSAGDFWVASPATTGRLFRNKKPVRRSAWPLTDGIRRKILRVAASASTKNTIIFPILPQFLQIICEVVATALPKGGLRAHSARPAIHRVVAADAPARRCGEHARDRSEWTLRGSKASKV